MKRKKSSTIFLNPESFSYQTCKKLLKNNKIIIALFLFAFFKTTFFSYFGITMLNDDLQNFTGGMRILHGDRIYAEYQSFFPIIADYLMAGLLFLTNKSYVGVITFYSIIISFLFPMLFLLIKKISSTKVALLFSVGLMFSFLRVDLLFFLTFFIASFLLVIKYGETKKIALTFYSGLFLALGSLFRLDFAVYYFIGICVFLLIIYFQKKDKNTYKAFLLLILTPLLFNLIIFFYLITNRVFDSYLAHIQAALYAKQNYSQSLFTFNSLIPENISLESLYKFWNGWLFLIWGIISLIYVAHLIRSTNLKKISIKDSMIMSMGATFFFSLIYLRNELEIAHFVKGGLFFFPFLASLTTSSLNKHVRSIGLISFLGFFLVQIVFSFWFINFSRFPIDFPQGGRVYVNKSYIQNTTLPSKEMLQAAVVHLRKAKPEERVFVAPYMSMLYFLSDRQNPTMYDNLLNGYLIKGFDEEYVISALKKYNVNYIVYDRDGGPKGEKGVTKMRNYYPTLDNYIIANYKVNKKIGGWLLMSRK